MACPPRWLRLGTGAAHAYNRRMKASFADRLAVLPQYLLPKQALTQLAGRLARAQGGRWTTWAITRFVARYGIRMEEAAEPRASGYASFNDFFTRALREGARPLAKAPLLCPVDGAISQCGPLQAGQLLQAKGHHYSAQALLGGDADLAERLQGGHFATLYLSPRDYHRIHMPCEGRLKRMVHVPGALFSVNPVTARGVPDLFARNERLVCEFAGPAGDFVMVLVGATIVGSMATVWHGVVNPPRPGQLRRWDYGEEGPVLRQGEEMGRFLLGSTVIVLCPAGVWHLPTDWQAGRSVRMGEAMGLPG